MSRWFCFDIGEVLVDETRVWSTWAAHVGTTPLTFMAVLGAELAAGRSHLSALHRFGIADPTDDTIEGALGGLQARDLYPDALPTLDALRGEGYRVAIAGNQPALRTGQLRAAGIDTEVLVTSEELGATKPEAAFFAAVLELLGSPDPGDVAYVGDRPDNDIAPARAAGFRTVWLRRGPWGALADADGVEADLIVSSLAQLVSAPEAAFR